MQSNLNDTDDIESRIHKGYAAFDPFAAVLLNENIDIN
jgi:hypothetical protein